MVVLLAYGVAVLAAEPQRVLVLHSYHQGFPWSDSLQAGVEAAFSGAEPPPELSVEHMDAKRHEGRVLYRELADLYAVKYDRWRPDLVVSLDDDALRFLCEYRERLFPGAPVVFGGLDREDYDPGLLAGRSGYTGVVERLDLASTVDVILHVQPEIRRILYVHDRTVSGLAHRRAADALSSRYQGRVELAHLDEGGGLTEQALLDRLAGVERDTAVYFLGFFRDRTGTPLEAAEIIPRIAAASPVPVYSHAKAHLGYGIVGGKLLSGYVHGESVGRKALELLDGRPVAQTPVSVESSNALLFDYRQLVRFDIAERRLPLGSTVLYAPGSAFERHRTAILWWGGAFVLLLGLVGVLVASLIQTRRVKRRLADSEGKYRLLVENQSDLTVKLDREGRYQFVSPSFCRTFGKTENELLGEPFTSLVHPHDLPETLGVIAGLTEPPHRDRVEHRSPTPFGWRWFAWSGTALIDEQGRYGGLVANGQDVTERHETQEALLQSEAKYRAMFEDNQAIKLLIDPLDGRIVEANSAAGRFYGYSKDELEGMFISDINSLPPEEIRHRMTTVEAQGRGYFEFRHRLASGEVRAVEVDSSPLTVGGRRLLYSIVHDVTEKKRAEQALRDSEALLQATEATAHIGGWEWDVAARRGSWTEETRRIMGQPPGADPGVGTLALMRSIKRFGVDAQKQLRELIGRCVRNGEPWDVVVPMRSPQGEDRWVRVIGRARRRNDRVVKVLGNVMDVTEQVQAEERIRYLANHDALTGLPSLRLARDRLQMAIEAARRSARLAALLFVDLDGFKEVNDRYGHDAGDHVLQTVGMRLKESVRQTDTVARIGGDEFLMILTNLNAPEEAERLAGKVVEALSAPITWGDAQLRVGASIGIAVYPHDGEDASQLLRLSDQAMYRVKRSTKNAYGFASRGAPT